MSTSNDLQSWLKPQNSAESFLAYLFTIGVLHLSLQPSKNEERCPPYFFTSGFSHTGFNLNKLGRAYAEIVNQFDPEIIFGPAYKGLTIALATAQTLDRGIGYAFNRGEEEDNGKWAIVGMPVEGKRVVIVYDMITSERGLSSKAFHAICEYGGIPVSLVIGFDRQERANDSHLSIVQKFEKSHKIPVRAIATLSDLIQLLQTSLLQTPNGEFARILDEILIYRRKYGISSPSK